MRASIQAAAVPREAMVTRAPSCRAETMRGQVRVACPMPQSRMANSTWGRSVKGGLRRFMRVISPAMGKDKLRKWKENATFSHVFEPDLKDIVDGATLNRGQWAETGLRQ